MDLRLLRYFVTTVEEGQIARAASRLNMTQPPLSRAIRQLESELGTQLLSRNPTGVAPTPPGQALYTEARALLDSAEQLPLRIGGDAPIRTLRLGALDNVVAEHGIPLADAFRGLHPTVAVKLVQTDFRDMSAGLVSFQSDVAITWAPLDDRELDTWILRESGVVAVMRAEDPLAEHSTLRLAELDDTRLVQLGHETDPITAAFWNVPLDGAPRTGPPASSAAEILHAIHWDGAIALCPAGHPSRDGITTIPVVDMAPCQLVVASRHGDTNPLIESFVAVARLQLSDRRSTAPHVPAP